MDVNGRDATFKPLARSIETYAICSVGDNEILMLDGDRLEYHTLNSSAFGVWQLCDGNRTLREIQHGLFEANSEEGIEIVEQAMTMLDEAGLLASSVQSMSLRRTRRTALKFTAAGLVGSVVLPVVKSITAPDAASAVSRCGDGVTDQPCGETSGCISCCCCGPIGASNGNCRAADVCVSNPAAACI